MNRKKIVIKVSLNKDKAISLFLFVCFSRQCNRSGCPGNHFVNQAGIERTEIRLPLSPEGLDQSSTPPPLSQFLLFCIHYLLILK